jgi:hypothetical protein
VARREAGERGDGFHIAELADIGHSPRNLDAVVSAIPGIEMSSSRCLPVQGASVLQWQRSPSVPGLSLAHIRRMRRASLLDFGAQLVLDFARGGKRSTSYCSSAIRARAS